MSDPREPESSEREEPRAAYVPPTAEDIDSIKRGGVMREPRQHESTDREKDGAEYVPPAAEDIDMSHEPAETVGAAARTIASSAGGTGVEESERWH